MRILTILLYLISIIPHVGTASSLCQGQDQSIRSQATQLSHTCNTSEVESCDFETNHHVHAFCSESGSRSIRPSNQTEIGFVVTDVQSPFEALFRSLSLRAPPVQHIYEKHALPSLYGHTLVKTTQFLC